MSTVHLLPSSLFFTAPSLHHLGPSSSHFIRVYLHLYFNCLYTPRSSLSREEYVYKFAVVLFPSLYRISLDKNVVELSTFSEADWTKLQQLLNVSAEDYNYLSSCPQLSAQDEINIMHADSVTLSSHRSISIITERQSLLIIFLNCEQVLFVRFTIIPPRLTDQCNFITVL